MSSLNWKSRMFVAVATASMLTGAGAVALANATTSTPDPTAAPTTASSGTDATALQRSLDDLLSTVGGLEKSVADGSTPAGTKPMTRSGADDSSSVTDDAGSDSSVADDDSHDDGSYDDDSYDDGSYDDDSYGDDSDHSAEDNGGVQGSDEDSHVDD